MGDNASREGSGEHLHRRGFFTQGFRHLLKPLADIVERRLEPMRHLEEMQGIGADATGTGYGAGGESAYPAGGVWQQGAAALDPGRTIRPPGALAEAEFLLRCTSCAKCVDACPVRAIRLATNPDPARDRKPVIDPAVQACVVCDDLSCMKACPTGALQLVPREAIRMGLAVLRADICVRTRGEDCQICVDKCPIGPSALAIAGPGAPVDVRGGCTGCGVCEMYCPTEPRAIVVEGRRL